MIKNYVSPSDLKKIEDYSSLLIGLELLHKKDSESYSFKSVSVKDLASEVVLFALLRVKENDFTVSFDVLQDVALMFGLSMVSLIEIIRKLEILFPKVLVFSDNSGIKNVQFLRNISEEEALNHYYQSR